jgi:hypothetical protein
VATYSESPHEREVALSRGSDSSVRITLLYRPKALAAEFHSKALMFGLSVLGSWAEVRALQGGVRGLLESSILFSFETDFTGRVKAGPQIETWQGRSAAAFTPAVILFIALPEAEDNIEPG